MERIVITILPPHPADGLLSVTDAMQQVLDTIALFSRAQQAMASPAKAFDWRLERASTNSPLTITALAVPVHPDDDIIEHARQIKDVVSSGLVNLMDSGEPAWWMQPDVLEKARSLFERNLNGIARTEISLSDENVINIDRHRAAAGVRAIQGFDALSVG